MASAADLFYLPDDCWVRIFKLLTNGDDADYDRYLKLLSTLSKEFLSITNRHKFSLIISSATRPLLPHYFQRFPNITSLNLSRYHTADLPSYHAVFKANINAILLEVSRFPLNLTTLDLSNKPIIPVSGLRAFSEKITTLTSLTCSCISSINTTDMLLIADCFPLLEELDLSNPGNGYSNDCTVGVEALSLALLKLRKVNLSRHQYINNKLLFHLFKNCKFLEVAIIIDCHQLTNAGIASALHVRPTLRSLSFTYSNSLVDLGVCPQLESIIGFGMILKSQTFIFIFLRVELCWLFDNYFSLVFIKTWSESDVADSDLESECSGKTEHKKKESERECRHKAILYWFISQHKSSQVPLHFQGTYLLKHAGERLSNCLHNCKQVNLFLHDLTMVV
jgi:hypothetical protein